MRKVTVRPAEESDMDWISHECITFSKYYGSKRPAFGDEVAARGAMSLLMRDHFVRIAQDDKGERLGFIAAVVSPYFFNPSLRILTEMLWWVCPTARNSKAALSLISELIDWGKKNVDWIFVGCESFSPLSDKSMARRGFRLQELTYMMEV